MITRHWVESVNATMINDVHRTWGYKDPKTGLFSGMSGQLQRKEADIGGLNTLETHFEFYVFPIIVELII